MVNKTLELSQELTGDGYSSIIYNAKSNIQQAVCNIDFGFIFYYFFVPLLMGLIFLLLIIYKEQLLKKFYKFFQSGGYIKIMYIMPNKQIKFFIKKLDKFNIFEFKNKRYSLEKMYNFIIGYDRYNFPIFMYDFGFILPLMITKEKLTKEIRSQIKDVQQLIDLSEQDSKISAISMRLDPQILKTVYDKKLISDLYSISGDDSFKKMIFWAVVIGGGLMILYYTGGLQIALDFLGVKI